VNDEQAAAEREAVQLGGEARQRTSVLEDAESDEQGREGDRPSDQPRSPIPDEGDEGAAVPREAGGIEERGRDQRFGTEHEQENERPPREGVPPEGTQAGGRACLLDL
jgi:hypothetical protein